MKIIFEHSLKTYDKALKLSNNNLKVLENKSILLKMKDWETISELYDKINIYNTIYWILDYKIQTLKQLNKEDELIPHKRRY